MGGHAQLPEALQEIPEPCADMPHWFTLSQPLRSRLNGYDKDIDQDSRCMKFQCPHTVVVLNCYWATDVIKIKDPFPRKMHVYTCHKTLCTIIGRNPGPPKHKGSEILSPLWLSLAYYRALHIVSAELICVE